MSGPLTLPNAAFLDSPATTVTATEEGRAFFQARLSIFGFWLFALAGGSWFVLTISQFLAGADRRFDEHAPFSPGSSLHLTNALLAGALWLTTRRGQRPGPVLHTLDVGVSLGLIAVWGLSGAMLKDPMVGSFIALLSFSLGILARAIIVPSTARRTLTIGGLGALVITGFALFRAPPGKEAAAAIPAFLWSASAATLGAVASQTIFGLRREVQQARILGQYTLETKLGEGGMGTVWRARHQLLRRPTAIKLLPPERMGEAALRRFEREVQHTARLTHPNTVAIYDYGRTRDGIFYYAMELLEGIDLQRLVEQDGAQPAGRVVHILTQICSALAEAHDSGLVHRDVKPANILLSPRNNEHEVAKILDFGLVKSIETDEPKPSATAANTITGTPLYLAPEAILSPSSVDSRSDLYALGAVAWFLLAGRPPFEGNSIVAVCGHHLHTPPARPSLALGEPLPQDLEDIILACLEKKPTDRPSDARAIRGRLEACSAARDWTAEHAANWWALKQPETSRRVSEGAPRTVALDVVHRQQQA